MALMCSKVFHNVIFKWERQNVWQIEEAYWDLDPIWHMHSLIQSTQLKEDAIITLVP